MSNNNQENIQSGAEVSLYVGDLDDNITERQLYEAFKGYGNITGVQICRNSHTRETLGYGYVNFTEHAHAAKAKDELSYHPLIPNGNICRIMWVNKDPTSRRRGTGNIYIKNLNPAITERDLYTTFRQLGEIISCKVVTDRVTGKSRGYGYVHFANPKDSEKAIELVDGKDMMGQQVFLEAFVPKAEREANKNRSWTNIFVKEIPDSIDSTEKLQEPFSEFGDITSPKLMMNEDGTSKGFGFINFAEHESAVNAVEEMNEKEVDGKVLYVARAQTKRQRMEYLQKEHNKKKRENQKLWAGRNLYVKNLHEKVTEDELKAAFEEFGKTASVRIMKDKDGYSRGFGFVSFIEKEDANKALEGMRNQVIPGYEEKSLYVAHHEPKEERARRMAKHKNDKKASAGGFPGGVVYGYYPGMVMPAARMAPRMQPMPARPPVDLTKEILSLPAPEQKAQLGEHLFKRISQLGTDPTLASKITGMFLHAQWPIEQKASLLTDDRALQDAIANAQKILQGQGA